MVPQNLGFDSWLELYEFIQREKLHEDDRISLVFPADSPAVIEDNDMGAELVDGGREVILLTDQIRASAFTEIYERLPKMDNVNMILDIVETSGQMTGKQYSRPVMEFIRKFPTRTA